MKIKDGYVIDENNNRATNLENGAESRTGERAISNAAWCGSGNEFAVGLIVS